MAFAQSLSLGGIVKDSAGVPIAGAQIALGKSALTATTGADGRFSFANTTAIRNGGGAAPESHVRNGILYLSFLEAADASITAYGPNGQTLSRYNRKMSVGDNALPLASTESGLRFYKVSTATSETLVKVIAIDGATRSETISHQSSPSPLALAKQARAAAVYFDVVTATKAGYLKSYLDVSTSDATDLSITMLKETSPKFSFFVASMAALIKLSGSDNGFGGDLRFGETGAGAGLRGADKICRTIAETSMPGSGNKGWRAFLSVTADADGKPVDAISRVGQGPWYDRVGRLLAPTKTDLVNVRPMNGDATIQLDLPNENGIPNKKPDPTQAKYDDNHHMLTGSSETGTLKSASSTCKDWTTSEAVASNGQPGVGFAWPRGGRVSNQGSHWMSTYDAPGCGAGIGIVEDGPGNHNILTVGEGGGYGGFYCFALNP